MVKTISPPPISGTIERLRKSSGLAVQNWADEIRVRSQDYVDLAKGHHTYTGADVEKIASNLELGTDSLYSGQIDFRAFARKYQKNTLPEKYHFGQFSKLRTVISVLDGFEDYYGWEARLNVMSALGITEAALSSPESNCSSRLIADVCQEIDAQARPHHLFFLDLGAYSTVTYSDSPLAKVFSRYSTPKELYERSFYELVPEYENNHDYRVVEIGHDYCHVELRPKLAVVDAFGTTRFTNGQNCLVKAGVMSTLVGYLGLPCAHVTETECVYRGNKRCLFEIDFKMANRLLDENKRAAN